MALNRNTIGKDNARYVAIDLMIKEQCTRTLRQCLENMLAGQNINILLSKPDVKNKVTGVCKTFLNKEQYNRMYPGPLVIADLDITFLSALIRLFSTTVNPQVWSKPGPRDFSLEADTWRLRDLRNKWAHRVSIELDDNDFESMYKCIHDILSRLTKHTKDPQTTYAEMDDRVKELRRHFHYSVDMVDKSTSFSSSNESMQDLDRNERSIRDVSETNGARECKSTSIGSSLEMNTDFEGNLENKELQNKGFEQSNCYIELNDDLASYCSTTNARSNEFPVDIVLQSRNIQSSTNSTQKRSTPPLKCSPRAIETEDDYITIEDEMIHTRRDHSLLKFNRKHPERSNRNEVTSDDVSKQKTIMSLKKRGCFNCINNDYRSNSLILTSDHSHCRTSCCIDSISFDQNNYMFLADCAHNSVQVIDTDGYLVDQLDLRDPRGLCFTGDHVVVITAGKTLVFLRFCSKSKKILNLDSIVIPCVHYHNVARTEGARFHVLCESGTVHIMDSYGKEVGSLSTCLAFLKSFDFDAKCRNYYILSDHSVYCIRSGSHGKVLCLHEEPVGRNRRKFSALIVYKQQLYISVWNRNYILEISKNGKILGERGKNMVEHPWSLTQHMKKLYVSQYISTQANHSCKHVVVLDKT